MHHYILIEMDGAEGNVEGVHAFAVAKKTTVSKLAPVEIARLLKVHTEHHTYHMHDMSKSRPLNLDTIIAQKPPEGE